MSDLTAPTGRSPKNMSSRLMTMKFMQRAAANRTSAPQSALSPPTPGAQPSTRISSKRHKTNDYSPPTAAVPDYDAAIEMKLAADAEEAKRQDALGKLQTGSGETRWVFAYHEGTAIGSNEKEEIKETKSDGLLGVKIVRFGEEDVANSEKGYGLMEKNVQPWSEGGEGVGRMRFGTWKEAEKVKQEDNSGSSSDHPSDDNTDDSERDSERDSEHAAVDSSGQGRRSFQAAERARAAIKAQRKVETKSLKKMAEERRRKSVNLNTRRQKLGTISSGRANPNKGIFKPHDYRAGKN